MLDEEDRDFLVGKVIDSDWLVLGKRRGEHVRVVVSIVLVILFLNVG